MARWHFLGRLRRIGWQLPLSIAGLLLVVVATFTWTAYREVRLAAVAAAGERLEDVSRQLADLLARSVEQRLAETQRVAGDPAVLAALTAPAPGVVASAGRSLERLLESSEQVEAVELWDTTGRRLLKVRRPGTPDTLPVGEAVTASAAGDTAAVSRLRSAADVVWYEVAAGARQDGRTLGYVVQRRRLSSSPQAARLIADLIGMDAAFFVGEPEGTWTDLSRVVDGPAADVSGADRAVEYQASGGSWRVGAGMPIGGTSWVVWVEFPRERVLERSRAFLGGIVPFGLVIVILGAAGGWVLSRRMTTRLGHVTAAASAIADGEYGRRVPVGQRDELGELARAFNTMAGSLEELLGQQEAAHEALRRSEQGFRLLFASNPVPMWVYDLETLRFLEVNDAAVAHYGYSRDEFLRMRLTDIRPPEDVPQLLADVAKDRPALSRSGEWRHRLKDGRTIDVEITSHTLAFGDRQAALVVARDITQRKRAEAELHKLTQELERRVAARTAQLEAANRELEAFSYSVSHDLRAPLRSIHGFSQAVLEDYRDRLDEQGVNYLRRVCAGAERMGQLIDDLLELARVSRGELRREVVDLSRLAHQIAADLRHAGPQRHVRFRIGDRLVAHGDQRLLGLVLRNLLDNAWKFSSRKAHATIEVGAVSLDARPAYFVRDDGAGFDMAYADKLFGPFQRLHAPGEFPGTGVGLALVQRIIHRHGGQVWAESAVGAGATFYFTLEGP